MNNYVSKPTRSSRVFNHDLSDFARKLEAHHRSCVDWIKEAFSDETLAPLLRALADQTWVLSTSQFCGTPPKLTLRPPVHVFNPTLGRAAYWKFLQEHARLIARELPLRMFVTDTEMPHPTRQVLCSTFSTSDTH